MPPKGRRELPNDTVLLDGPVEGLAKRGTFVGQHVYTSLQGVAVHINAFNFPCSGMLETGLLPDGALQFIAGSVGDLFEHLPCQDIVSFTGSAATAQKLQNHPVIARESVRFVAERDSLNATVLGPDCSADTPEFELFVKEVVREMTVKAGQKCTAAPRRARGDHLLDLTL